MSRRRRRDEDEEENLNSEDENEKSSQKSLSQFTDAENEDLDVSEYESLDEEVRDSTDDEYEEDNTEDVEEQNDVEQEKGEERTEEEEQKESDVKDDVSETKRESGDGKEQSDNEVQKQESELQEDSSEKEKKSQEEEEDPSFIPTKGAFFQHDMRLDSQSKGRGRDRRIWDNGPVKWSHDMYVMEEQMPKTRETLIYEYGYDLRSLPDGANPPSDAYKPRGRGRGFRGRRSRGQPRRGTFQTTRQKMQSPDFQENFPPLQSNPRTNYKHKSRNYYKSSNSEGGKREESPTHDSENQDPGSRERLEEEEDVDKFEEQESTRVNEGEQNDPGEGSKKEFSNLMNVINSRENSSSSGQSTKTTFSNSRQRDKSRNHLSYSNYQESHKPRRYSSLRQRSANSPVDKQMANQYSKADARYSNFAKPVQPNQTFRPVHGNPGPSDNKLHNDPVKEKPSIEKQGAQSEPRQPQLPPSSHHITPTQTPKPLEMNQTSQTNLGQPESTTIPNVPITHPMFNPSYLDLEAYNRGMMALMMQQQMSQMTLDQLQQHQQGAHNLPTQQLDSPNTALPPEPQTIAHPPHMQMNPLLPQVTQGSLGSIMRPPPPQINPPTYFTGPVGVNLGMPQPPFPFNPNMMAQQVGGVTYFNTPSSPSLPQGPTQQGSPRRPNAAIPIMPPGMYGPSTAE